MTVTRLVLLNVSDGVMKISYKNRNGVRKEGALDWRELYEILSYMVKQPFYCGEDQKKYYHETKQKADRDKMNPVYKRFFDIEDSVKANRLETRERAIANGWETKIDENGHVVSDDAVQKKHNFHKKAFRNFFPSSLTVMICSRPTFLRS